jgi:hypothetical protein
MGHKSQCEGPAACAQSALSRSSKTSACVYANAIESDIEKPYVLSLFLTEKDTATYSA